MLDLPEGINKCTSPMQCPKLYRVTLVVSDLGWVDLDFECSTACPTVPGLVGIWLKRLGN